MEATGGGERGEDMAEDERPLATVLWSQGPLHLLIYTLKCDPAVRVRRAALALLTRVEVGKQGPYFNSCCGAVCAEDGCTFTNVFRGVLASSKLGILQTF